MALTSSGNASALSFLIATFISFFPKLLIKPIWDQYWLIALIIYIILFNIFIYIYCAFFESDAIYQISLRGGLLGLIFGIGTLIVCESSTLTSLGWYIIALATFHWSEYFITSIMNPKTLTLECYLLDHSTEYKMAALLSWVEFAVEYFIFPGLKLVPFVRLCGLGLVLLGELMRKLAIITAGSNFNHHIQRRRHSGHHLVTHGVYSICRHPSYVGWFFWSIGTQLILANPICIIGYAVASYGFFKERILEEELYLYSFFGDEFVEYQKRVGTGFPYIHGYNPPT